MFHFGNEENAFEAVRPVAAKGPLSVRGVARAPVWKRVFDVTFAIPGLILIGILVPLLLFLNPFLNPGPVFFRQVRMGSGGHPFVMWKFRTMVPCALGREARDPHAPLEQERITRLGRWLRKTRLDELPNFINVLKGEMSVIGPRPDAWDHGLVYSQSVPRYADRFRVKPGITGLAQVRAGYADNPRAIHRKARLDVHYVDRLSLFYDLYIAWRTVRVMVSGMGAK